MSSKSDPVTSFHVRGQCLGFIFKNGCEPKYLKLEIDRREYWLKIPKDLRDEVESNPNLTQGAWLEVWGTQKIDSGKLKLKIDELQPLGDRAIDSPLESPANPVPVKAAPARILVCQKSDCWKRGGKAICASLEEGLRDRGLDGQVKVQTTGCLKQCKKGPNVVVVPDKARYSNVSARDAEKLLDKHFSPAAVR